MRLGYYLRVVVLDASAIVLRNIDEIFAFPAPTLCVRRGKDPQALELEQTLSGRAAWLTWRNVYVVEPSLSELRVYLGSMAGALGEGFHGIIACAYALGNGTPPLHAKYNRWVNEFSEQDDTRDCDVAVISGKRQPGTYGELVWFRLKVRARGHADAEHARDGRPASTGDDADESE